jgi:hypothetical protein
MRFRGADLNEVGLTEGGTKGMAGKGATEDNEAAKKHLRESFGKLDQLCHQREQALTVDLTELLNRVPLAAIEAGQAEEEYPTLALEAAARALQTMIDVMEALSPELAGEDARATRAMREFESLEAEEGKVN